jgi:hypothetical protein
MIEPQNIESDGLNGTGKMLGIAMNAWKEKIIYAAKLIGGNGIKVSSGTNGNIISSSPKESRIVILSGSSSPYSASEVYAGPSGSWVVRPSGISIGSLVEANGVSGLDSKVVVAHKNQFGWFFVYDRDGDPGCVSKFCVFAGDSVTGAGIEGVTFHVFGPNGFESECTTGEDGECCFYDLSPGVYEITQTSGPEGYTLHDGPVYYELLCNVSINGCACTSTPTTIHLTIDKPDSISRLIKDCTFQWTDTPPALLPLGLGEKEYLSIQTFRDIATDDVYRYHLQCVLNFFTLTRVYEESAYGSPYRDVIRYKWPISLSGNSCNPFYMDSGIMYSGGDNSCVVTIQG